VCTADSAAHADTNSDPDAHSSTTHGDCHRSAHCHPGTYPYTHGHTRSAHANSSSSGFVSHSDVRRDGD